MYQPDESEQQEAMLPPREAIETILSAENLAAELADDAAKEIARKALEYRDMDKDTMSDWFDRMEKGLDLARLVKSDKTYPFANAANVKYPLVTSAALQFNARAYPAIAPPSRPVKARVWGKDQGGQKAARAERVSEHMSYQLLAQIPEWEETTDKLLVLLPIVGTVVRKWWYDATKGRLCCRLIEPGKFIVHDEVENLNDAPRLTEELTMYPHEITERISSGFFIDFEFDTTGEDDQDAHEFVEQHCRIDLDDDGYEEPYIATVHCDTQKLVRLVPDFERDDVIYKTEERQVQVTRQMQDAQTGMTLNYPALETQQVETGIIAIRRNSYFVAFHFLPGMDGGFHGTGLGLLLGDISESINTIINMQLDAGHYASLGGGFIGKEFRMKGGAQRMRPGEWRMAGDSGSDIRSAIVPLTYPGPDATLFQMLSLLIDAGREIASVKDVVTGEQPRQQQTATTTLALIEQGMAVFTAAYKRIFRSCTQEYAIIARMNQRLVTPEEYMEFHEEQVNPQEDYGLANMDIQPVADPRSVTKMQRAAKAEILFQWSQAGLVDQGEALMRMAEAIDIEDVDELMPKQDPMQAQVQQQMLMLQMQGAQADVAEKMAKVELTMAQVEETRAQTVEALAGVQNETARVALEAKQQRLNGLFKMLEEERARLAEVLRGTGSVANRSGNQDAATGNAATPSRAQREALDGLLQGQEPTGGGQTGPTTGGAMGGGLL